MKGFVVLIDLFEQKTMHQQIFVFEDSDLLVIKVHEMLESVVPQNYFDVPF